MCSWATGKTASATAWASFGRRMGVRYTLAVASIVGGVQCLVAHQCCVSCEQYVGMWKANVRHGWGAYSSPNGEVYEGQFEGGRPHGVGRLINAAGDVYSGEFANGRSGTSEENRHSRRHHTHSCWFGAHGFPGSRYNGLGTLTRSDGEMFVGCVRDGVAHGLGVLVLRTGEKYKGQFAANQREGKGACLYPSKAKYYGGWRRGLPHGVGAWLSPDGSERYVGQWEYGRRNGQGRYYFQNGDIFDGHFVNDVATVRV
jgi:hypothetical protein